MSIELLLQNQEQYTIKFDKEPKHDKKLMKVKDWKTLQNPTKKFWKSLKRSINKSKPNSSDIKIEDLYHLLNDLLGQNNPNEADETEIPIKEGIELDCEISEEELRRAVIYQKMVKPQYRIKYLQK